MGDARLVVLVCGPPGGGKTSWTQTRHVDGTPPTPYDIDDPRWGGDEQRFRRAIAGLATDPEARAYVIRSGARRASREHWRRYIAATAVVLVGHTLTLDELVDRIRRRNRPRPSLDRQIAAASAWLDRYEPDPVDLDGPWVAGSERGTDTPMPLRAVCVPGTPRTSPDHMSVMPVIPDQVQT